MIYLTFSLHRSTTHIPENWGPLVTKPLGLGTGTALFSSDQWSDISNEN